MKRQTQPSAQTKTPQKLNISKIDLTSLTVNELLVLRDNIDNVLLQQVRRLSDNDIHLEFNIKVFTKEGAVHDNEGQVNLKGILHPRRLPTAPAILEQTIHNNIIAPLQADVYDVLQDSNPTQNSLEPFSLANIPTLPAMLPGE